MQFEHLRKTMIYEFCNDCPDSVVLEDALEDDDGWVSNCGSRACTRAENPPRHAGKAFRFSGPNKKVPVKTHSPDWCPLKQENLVQELTQAAEKAQKLGGKLIENPLNPKRCTCENQKEPENPWGAFQSEGNCYACVNSFRVEVAGKDFWCCKKI